ncbi:universal stress protein [Rhodococcoides corynebacterioides]|uniref:universal stress protein n=1 Tax=Rhodococcoides corynebacterioides TaxID=53972 RepID=UPI0008322916|nr:universal stress protein [Rhodococcus corynebacterioides]
MTPAPITVGIDGSDGALEAARWAAAYARVTHTPLRVVHSMPDSEWYLGRVDYVPEQSLRDEFHALGRRHLDAAVDAIVEVDPSATVERVCTETPVASYLTGIESSLVVLGSVRTGPVRDLVLGGRTIRVLRHARCPVMIRRHEGDGSDEGLPVVVGYDGSPESDRAVLAAFEFAATVHVHLLVAHFWGVGVTVGAGMGAGYADWERIDREERRWVHDRVRPVQDKFPDVHVTVSSSSSSPAAGLRSLSSSSQLIVVGSRGRGKVTGMILGSVSQNVVHHAHCSVLVVR